MTETYYLAMPEAEIKPEYHHVIVGGREIDRAGNCDKAKWHHFECSDCGRPIKIKVGCGNRFASFCKTCSRKWQQKTRFRYFQGACNMKHPKFLTLTLLKEDGRLGDRLTQLWEMRKRLFFYLSRHKHKNWKGEEEDGYKIGAWCGVIEPPNHIHLIVDMEYIPQEVISQIWKTVTGDSFIVDVRTINVAKSPRAVFGYITKYMSKAANWEGINLSILKGFHLIASYGLKLPEKIKRAICFCGSLKPLHKIDEIDFKAMFPYEVDGHLRPGGKWSEPILIKC